MQELFLQAQIDRSKRNRGSNALRSPATGQALLHSPQMKQLTNFESTTEHRNTRDPLNSSA
jgi:hypothetical protein